MQADLQTFDWARPRCCLISVPPGRVAGATQTAQIVYALRLAQPATALTWRGSMPRWIRSAQCMSMQKAQSLFWLKRKFTNSRSRLSSVLPAASENWAVLRKISSADAGY